MMESAGKPNADCHCRSSMPCISAKPSNAPWEKARPTGAGKADRVKRGRRRWQGRRGQVRLTGAREADWGRQGRRGQARPTRVGETGGGRQGWCRKARPMGTVFHRPHARAHQHQPLGKPLVQIPSQHSPFGSRLSRCKSIKTKESNKRLRSSSKVEIPINPNTEKIQTYRINRNT